VCVANSIRSEWQLSANDNGKSGMISNNNNFSSQCLSGMSLHLTLDSGTSKQAEEAPHVCHFFFFFGALPVQIEKV